MRGWTTIINGEGCLGAVCVPVLRTYLPRPSPFLLLPFLPFPSQHSGRLIILPKKSWHVWNQDNREKVLRDERLHHEEQEKQAEQQRYVGVWGGREGEGGEALGG